MTGGLYEKCDSVLLLFFSFILFGPVLTLVTFADDLDGDDDAILH